MGVHRALVAYARRRSLAEADEPATLARDLRLQAERALGLLETGLGRNAREA
jgi:hypothetical protein